MAINSLIPKLPKARKPKLPKVGKPKMPKVQKAKMPKEPSFADFMKKRQKKTLGSKKY